MEILVALELVPDVARVSDGDDCLDSLLLEDSYLCSQGLHLVQEDEVFRVGNVSSLWSNVTHQANGLSGYMLHNRLGIQTLELGDLGVVQIGHNHCAGLVCQEGNNTLDLVIELVITESHSVKLHQVVELGGSSPFKLAVPNSSLEEFSGIEPEHIIFSVLDLLDISVELFSTLSARICSCSSASWSHNTGTTGSVLACHYSVPRHRCPWQPGEIRRSI